MSGSHGMKFLSLMLACNAARMVPGMFQGYPRPELVEPRYTTAPSECSRVESHNRYTAALAKRERRAAKLRKENQQ